MDPTQVHTPSQLIDLFLCELQRRIDAGEFAPATFDNYERYLRQWQERIPAGIALADLKPFHLSLHATTRLEIYSVQRCFAWARKQQIIPHSPFIDVEKPPIGQRERVLSRSEGRRLLLACDIRPTRQRTVRRLYRRVERPVGAAAIAGAPVRPLRWFLMALGRMAARPGELRTLQWKHYRPELRQFELRTFKAKSRRRDGVRVRILLVDDVLARVLATWQRRRSPGLDDYVFLNTEGKPWTKAICKSVRFACHRAGLNHDDAEPVVAYTQRHTAATRAANPLDGSPAASLPQIGSWLGHSANSRITQRYVHLQTADMRSVQQRAARKPGSQLQSAPTLNPPTLQSHAPTPAPSADKPPADPNHEAILQALREPRSIDELARHLAIPIGDLNRLLLMLELKRRIRRLPGGRFERY
jgi:DprA winged helix domain/Phage integrase family